MSSTHQTAEPILAPHFRADRQDQQGLSGKLRALGITGSAFAAIQADIQPTVRMVGDERREVTLCDHNCTVEVDSLPTGGQYTCPAALSLNLGNGRPELVPTDLLEQGLLRTVAGIRIARGPFLDTVFPRYVQDFAIPSAVASALLEATDTDRVQVNLFGGSPETHPGYLSLVETLHSNGVEVHLTTTGRKIVRDAGFRGAFLQSPPDLLALGADDFASPDDAAALFSLPVDQLSAEWRKVPWQHGQRRKAVEAAQIVRLAAETTHFPQLLFNVVMHQRNLDTVEELLDVLAEHAPAAWLNPYPVQTGFLRQPGVFDAGELDRLSAFVDLMLDEHRRRATGGHPRWMVVPRIHYWLMLRAAIDTAADPAVASDLVAGTGIWTCFDRPGAGRCVQIAARGQPATSRFAGGHLGCFWNTVTVTDERQVWAMSAEDIGGWIFRDRLALARSSAEKCQGCAFPRMSFDSISLELGLGEAVRTAYLRARRTFLGY